MTEINAILKRHQVFAHVIISNKQFGEVHTYYPERSVLKQSGDIVNLRMPEKPEDVDMDALVSTVNHLVGVQRRCSESTEFAGKVLEELKKCGVKIEHKVSDVKPIPSS